MLEDLASGDLGELLVKKGIDGAALVILAGIDHRTVKTVYHSRYGPTPG